MASIFFRTIIIYITLTLSMRLMGKRELGELEVGELVTSLLLSEICSIPIDNPDIPLMNAIIPVLFIISLEIIVSVVKNKSSAMQKLVDGTPSYIIYKGRLNPDVLTENRISINELLGQMRQNGIGSIDEVEYCIIESNGKMSIIKKGDAGGLGHLLIADGIIQKNNLSMLGYDEERLMSELGDVPLSEVFILCENDEGVRYLVKKKGGQSP